MRLVFLLWIAVGGAAFGSIVEGGSGLLFGPGYSYWLTAPPGWMLDNESGVAQGSNAVFYPKGQTWSNAPVVCYTNTDKITPTESSPEQIAREEIERFHASGSPGYTGAWRETWKLPHGGQAEVWQFQGDRWGNFEAIAYIPEKGVISFVVITARTRKQFDAAYPSFRALVRSYQWFTDDVKFDAKGQPVGLPKTR